MLETSRSAAPQLCSFHPTLLVLRYLYHDNLRLTLDNWYPREDHPFSNNLVARPQYECQLGVFREFMQALRSPSNHAPIGSYPSRGLANHINSHGHKSIRTHNIIWSGTPTSPAVPGLFGLTRKVRGSFATVS